MSRVVGTLAFKRSSVGHHWRGKEAVHFVFFTAIRQITAPCGTTWVVFAEGENELPMVTEKVVLERHEEVNSSATDVQKKTLSVIKRQ